MENISEQTLTDFKTLFGKIKTVTVDASAESGDSDSDTETFNTYEELVQKLDEALTNTTPESGNYIRLLCMKGSILYEKAKLYMHKGLEIASTENLQRALEVIKSHANHDEIKFLHLRIINHLSYLLSQTGDHKTARTLLEDLEKTEMSHTVKVYSTEDLFTFDDKEPDQADAGMKLEKIIVNNLQMLSWIYGKSGMIDEQVKKNHQALQRQLNTGEANCSWALRSARLSTILLSAGYWKTAKHHLCAATKVVKFKETEFPNDKELPKARADLARAWVYYGLQLFATSKAYAMENLFADSGRKLDDLIDPPDSNVIEDVSKSELERDSTASENKDSQENIKQLPLEEEAEIPSASSEIVRLRDAESIISNLRFENFDVVGLETVVNSRTVSSTEEARTLFLHTQSWLKIARAYYTLKEYPLEYINAVLNLSELYRYLAYYEADIDAQYNVQKRRAETLETLCSILREARPQCYTVVSVELLRELAEVQLELMGLNLRKLYMLPVDEPKPTDYKQKMNAILDLKQRLENMGDALGKTQFAEEPSVSDSSQ